MPVLRLKLSDLATLSDSASETLAGSAGDLEAQVRKQFTFLPDPITVKVEGDEVIVEFPEETAGSRAEAARLAEKAGSLRFEEFLLKFQTPIDPAENLAAFSDELLGLNPT